jgi:radical SAM protein (TIGR01212 family)
MDELFHSFSGFLKNKFPGQKILKIPVHAGFSCPNRDGLFSKEGCIFCDSFAAGPIHGTHRSIEEQIEKYVAAHPDKKYIVYFQSHSNTYGPISELKRKFEIVFKYENIVGFFIGTRPDMISEPAFLLLEEINRRICLTVELGLQSIHASSLLLLNRNHTYQQFLETFQKLQALKIDTVIHLIIGIPGETRAHMLATIEEMNRLKPQGVKLHLLHVLKDTALYRQYQIKPFPLLSQDEYVEHIVFLLERLHPDIVIHRLTAEREREIFFAPEWALHKQAVLKAIKQRMANAGAFQGRYHVPEKNPLA